MISSNQRKLMLSGYLMENGIIEYKSSLKLQKFLFFYEAFAKEKGENADFSNLMGYKYGPVFSNVWGDYTHENSAFNIAAQKAYSANRQNINSEYAKKSMFIVSALSERDLSAITHKLNIWKSKESRIMQGERHVDLHETDFNEQDLEIIRMLYILYPVDMIDNSSIVEIDNHYFVFSKRDASRLTEQNYDTLSMLSENEELMNPIYAELDEEGRLIID